MKIDFNKSQKNFDKIQRKIKDEVILEYMLKIPKLKNDLITGEDSYNLSDRKYNDFMQDIQNKINAAKQNIKDPKILEKKLDDLNFRKNELKIERIINVRNQSKEFGNKILLQDEKLFTLVKYQNKLLNAEQNNDN